MIGPSPAIAVGAQQLGYQKLLRPLMFARRGGDPEAVHEATMVGLANLGANPTALRLVRRLLVGASQPVQLAGITFNGPVGLAAGMDKRATAVLAWASLGFGHVELGTITNRRQPGNPRPRMVRLPASHALLNRMGFNNDGAQATAQRLAKLGIWRGNNAAGLPIGISLGKSKAVPLAEAVPDYLASFDALAPHADYVAINVSSPNTPGLRSLQTGAELRELTTALTTRAAEVANQAALDPTRPLPLLVKVAPDLTLDALDQIASVCAETQVAGLIATNTTVTRTGLHAQDRSTGAQSGGLSGAPLTARALQVVQHLCRTQRLPVIGSGGVMTADDAQAMLDAGATAVQLYTGFVYAGTALVAEINRRHARAARHEERL